MHLVLHADLKVIVAVLSDTRQITHDRNAMTRQQGRRTDARCLEKLRRSDRARRKDDLPSDLSIRHYPAVHVLHAGAAATIEKKAANHGARNDRQIGST